MGFISEALWQMRQGEYKSAARVLGEHLHDEGLKASSKVSLMEWIAECYSNCEEAVEAARWFELAGRAALECSEFPTPERRRKALHQFERAMECYRLQNNLDGIKRMSSLKYSLSPKL